MNSTIEKLTYFYGIGNVQAKKILSRLLELKLITDEKISLNLYSLSDLRRILKNKKIFSELQDSTQIDLIYNPLRVISRPIIEIVDSELHRIISKIKIKFDIGGSYSRGKSTSGDIDIVVCTDLFQNLSWDKFMKGVNSKSSIIRFNQPFAQGSDKISVLLEIDLEKTKLLIQHPEYKKMYKCTKNCKIYVKCDIFLSNSKDYIFALLFAVGSGKFNIRMRALAKKKGYLLNNHGLFKKNNNQLEKLPIKTEKQIFEALNMTYKKPSQRIL